MNNEDEISDGDWTCPEHGIAIAEGQACPKCLDIAGDLLADCLEDDSDE
jgi:hypothetical protein